GLRRARPFISLPRPAGTPAPRRPAARTSVYKLASAGGDPSPATACGAHVPSSACLSWRAPAPTLRRTQPLWAVPGVAPPIVPGRGQAWGPRRRRRSRDPRGERLRRVGDAVEASRLVVGHEESAVGHHQHVGRPPGRDAALQPARRERLV